MAQNYENVLRLILIILLLFFIASAMRINESYVTGNFLGMGVTPGKNPVVDYGAVEAYKYGCYDSDGGENIQTRGVVTYRSASRQLSKQYDSCEGAKTLLEWACLGGGKVSNIGTSETVFNRECKYGCLNGACIDEKFMRGEDYSYNYPIVKSTGN